MPSHPDRVRRSYHEIEFEHRDTIIEKNIEINIIITRIELATLMSKREIESYILNRISRGILE